MGKKRERRGFTLIELMVVILIVGILAAVAVPILRGKIDSAKWSEAAATAGAIRSAVRAAYAENPSATLTGVCTEGGTLATLLGFRDGDLTGRYFNGGNFTISFTAGDPVGIATIAVSNTGTGLTGSGVLNNTTGWVYSP